MLSIGRGVHLQILRLLNINGRREVLMRSLLSPSARKSTKRGANNAIKCISCRLSGQGKKTYVSYCSSCEEISVEAQGDYREGTVMVMITPGLHDM